MSSRNPFERDILSQPEGLRALAATLDAMPGTLDGLTLERYERVVLTGMGASLYALYPVWLSLVERGYPAWWVDSGELMQEAPGLLRGRTLVWAASQSAPQRGSGDARRSPAQGRASSGSARRHERPGQPARRGWALARRDRCGHRARGRHPHLREHARRERDRGARAHRRNPGRDDRANDARGACDRRRCRTLARALRRGAWRPRRRDRTRAASDDDHRARRLARQRPRGLPRNQGGRQAPDRGHERGAVPSRPDRARRRARELHPTRVG